MRHSLAALIFARVTLFTLVTLASPPAFADGSDRAFHRVRDGNGQIIPCRCMLNGQRLPLGTVVCMGTPAGAQLARCDLSQNVTTWTPTGAPCGVSELPTARPAKG